MISVAWVTEMSTRAALGAVLEAIEKEPIKLLRRSL